MKGSITLDAAEGCGMSRILRRQYRITHALLRELQLLRLMKRETDRITEAAAVVPQGHCARSANLGRLTVGGQEVRNLC